MPTRNVVLTEHQAQLIESLVGSGRYQNASEVLREGLRMVERREADDAAKLEALRAAARLGTDAFGRGAFEEFSTAAALGDHLDALAARFAPARVREWRHRDGASGSVRRLSGISCAS